MVCLFPLFPMELGFLRHKVYNVDRFLVHYKQLNEEQRTFVHCLESWFVHPKFLIVLVSGGPGSGKSFTVIKTIEHIMCNQLRMAPTRRVAQHMNGRTIHSLFNIAFDKGSPMEQIYESMDYADVNTKEEYVRECRNASQSLHATFDCRESIESTDLVVIDEVGMVPFWLVEQIVIYIRQRKENVMFILVGDHFQLQPIRCKYNIFSVLCWPVTPIHLRHSIRFTKQYSHLIVNIKKFVKQNNLMDLCQYLRTRFKVLLYVTEEHLRTVRLVLAYRNTTIHHYNQECLKRFPGKTLFLPRIVEGKIDKEDGLRLKKNCPLFVTQHCEVLSGTKITFCRYNPGTDCLECTEKENEFKIHRNKEGLFPVVLGFATTIHKFQGETINDNQILIDFDASDDLHLIYTALSRIQSDAQLMGLTNLKY